MIAKSKIPFLCVIAIILITCAVQLATIRDGHNWGGDFAFFIHHAKNIAEGIDYSDTGLVYNPYYRHLSPESFPPVFPLMLAPVYKLRGLDLQAMKVEVILTFPLAMLAVYLVFRRELDDWPAAAMVAALTLSPWFWQFKDEVLSDIPFLLLLYLAFFWIRRYHRAHAAGKAPMLDAVLAAVFLCVAYGTRSLGMVVVPCVIGHDLLRYRKLTRLSVTVTLAFAVTVVLMTLFLRSDTSYFTTLAFSWQSIVARLILDTRPVSALWDNGYVPLLTSTLTALIVLAALIGYVIRCRRGIGLFELFVPLYVLPLLAAPAVYGTRYLLPLMPLTLYYAFTGLRELKMLKEKDLSRPMVAAMLIAIGLSHAAGYTKLDYGPIIEGPDKPESRELFEFIKANTDPNDVIVFRKPRVLSLYTGRPASVYHLVAPDQREYLWEYFTSIEARYIISGSAFTEDRMFLTPFLRQYGRDIDEVFRNADFAVYRIRRQDESAPSTQAG